MINGQSPDLLLNILSSHYLSRYAWPGPVINKAPAKDLKMSIVIPCYKEPDVLGALNSLDQCQHPECTFEIIIVINHSEDENEKVKAFNNLVAREVEEWCLSHNSGKYDAMMIKAFDLPAKSAGVGLARKIGMDEAVRRFEMINEPNGIIVCFDADCTCSPNYLVEIHQHYTKHPQTNVALLYYEHPLTGALNSDVYEAIVDYELHLRYYKNALRFADFPFCYHTIGSCITVSSQVYQRQGGMNKRKAGEDFYFLQKIFPLGQIHQITTATVYPSPRSSDRVPFGTGKAVSKILEQKEPEAYTTYNPQIFIELKPLFGIIPDLYLDAELKFQINRVASNLKHFLEEINFIKEVQNKKENAGSQEMFLKSFFQWFNGFMILKYVHFARDHYHENIKITEAANWILGEMLKNTPKDSNDKRSMLQQLRNIDRLN